MCSNESKVVVKEVTREDAAVGYFRVLFGENVVAFVFSLAIGHNPCPLHFWYSFKLFITCYQVVCPTKFNKCLPAFISLTSLKRSQNFSPASLSPTIEFKSPITKSYVELCSLSALARLSGNFSKFRLQR